EFPRFIRHLQTFETAVLHTLRAEGTAPDVVTEYKTLVRFINRDEFDCVRWAIGHAQAAACTLFWIPHQFAPQTLWGWLTLIRIKLGHGFTKQRAQDIFQHRSDFHALTLAAITTPATAPAPAKRRNATINRQSDQCAGAASTSECLRRPAAEAGFLPDNPTAYSRLRGKTP